MTKNQPAKRNVVEGVPFTTIPDHFLAHWMTRLSPSELKVMLYIYLRTLGFGKLSDTISYDQFLSGITTRDGRRLDEGAGVSRRALVDALASLEGKGLIRRYHSHSNFNFYSGQTFGSDSRDNSNTVSSVNISTATAFSTASSLTPSAPPYLHSGAASAETGHFGKLGGKEEKDDQGGKSEGSQKRVSEKPVGAGGGFGSIATFEVILPAITENMQTNHQHHQHAVADRFNNISTSNITGSRNNTSKKQVQNLPDQVQILPQSSPDQVQFLHPYMKPESLTINYNHENRVTPLDPNLESHQSTAVAAGASVAHHLVSLVPEPVRDPVKICSEIKISSHSSTHLPNESVPADHRYNSCSITSAELSLSGSIPPSPSSPSSTLQEEAVEIIVQKVIGISRREASRLVDTAFTRKRSVAKAESGARANQYRNQIEQPLVVETETEPQAGEIQALAYLERLVEYVTTNPKIRVPAAVLTTLINTGHDRTTITNTATTTTIGSKTSKPGHTETSPAIKIDPDWQNYADYKKGPGNSPNVYSPGRSSSKSNRPGTIKSRTEQWYNFDDSGPGPGPDGGNTLSQPIYSINAPGEPGEGVSNQVKVDVLETNPVEVVKSLRVLDDRLYWPLQDHAPTLARYLRHLSVEGATIKVSFVGVRREVDELDGWLAVARRYYPQLKQIEVLN